jgi:GxxExxY protein
MILNNEIVEMCKDVYEKLGAGLREKVYQNALNLNLSEKHRTILEYPVSINYKGHCLSICYPDILLEIDDEKIMIEIKCIGKLAFKDHLQLQGYLRHNNTKIGYLINFGTYSLEIYRYDQDIMTNLISKTISFCNL